MPLRLLLSLQVVVVVVVVVVLLLLGQLLLRLTSPPLPIALQLLLAVVFLRPPAAVSFLKGVPRLTSFFFLLRLQV
jgi:hypothetical protein